MAKAAAQTAMADELAERALIQPSEVGPMLGLSPETLRQYRNGTRKWPAYITVSLSTHLALSDRALRSLARERGLRS